MMPVVIFVVTCLIGFLAPLWYGMCLVNEEPEDISIPFDLSEYKLSPWDDE